MLSNVRTIMTLRLPSAAVGNDVPEPVYTISNFLLKVWSFNYEVG